MVTPSVIPLLRWTLEASDAAASYGSVFWSQLSLEYQTFRISPHQARQADPHFIMLLEGAHSVLGDRPGGREHHIGVFVGILGQPVE